MFLTREDGMILGPVCWLLGKLFDLLYQFVSFVTGNPYANLSVCVILFTLVIRGALFPLYFKQQKSSKLMSFIQPEIAKATKKYKGKTDQDSVMKQQMETQKIQKKYGVSMTSGCLTSILQLPIFYGLYRVIQNIPAYIPSMTSKYTDIVRILQDKSENYLEVVKSVAEQSKVSTVTMALKQLGDSTDTNKIIDVLDKFSSSDWNQVIEQLGLQDNATLANYVENFHQMNQLFGLNIDALNIANAPGWHISIALIIPILAALLQFIQSKITMKSSQNNNLDPNQQTANNMMKGMMYYMPIMSLVFCITLPIAIGLYWIVGSVVMIASQLIVDAYYSRQDKDELLAKCMEKAAAKQAKKKNPEKKSFYEKMMDAQAGNVSTDEHQTQNINKMATSRLKNYVNPAHSVDDSSYENRKNVTYKPGSIGSKANIMLQYQNKSNDKGGKK